TADRVTARRHHDDLVLRVTGSEGSVTVRNWFSSSAQRVERIEFADGKSWNEARIRELCSFAVHHHPDHHEPHQGRPDEKRDRYHEDRHGDDRHGASPAKGHDAVSDLIAQRLSLVPRFDFESLLEHLERPTERVLPAEEIARRWQAVAAYASALAAEHDESDEEAATPPGWSKPRVGSAAGWGFEGSVGTRSAPEFETLSGLTEGFRNLGGL
ncbi:MAG TPA: calcium-binding protein, partial [Hyphomicrobiaceae bacterium]|nr:calcium-binding protein [Hyphomicrobiaceae bacterium]